MSAYVVGKDHIDLMVSMAVRGTGADHGLRVFHEGEVRHFDLTTADEIGQILHNENVHSVNYRYNEQTEPETYVFEGHGIGSNLGGALIPWGHVLQAIRCYEYQSCEDTTTWGGSLANEICRALRLKVCGIIADESDAPWEWTREDMDKREQEIRARIMESLRS